MINTDLLRKQFIDRYGDNGKQIRMFFAPGRVNLIGEHLDYNGGLVMPAALSVGISAAGRSLELPIVRVSSMSLPGTLEIELNSKTLFDSELKWGNYVIGVIDQLIEQGYVLNGAEILFDSDLPIGAGLSSSAALEVLTAYTLLSLTGLPDIDRIKIALLCQNAEHRFIGVQCGIMDQFTVALGKRDSALLLNTESLIYETIPFKLENYRLVIMNTNKFRELTSSEYNRRRCECMKALTIIRQKIKLDRLVNLKFEEINKYLSDWVLRKRVRHIVTEQQRVIQAVEILRRKSFEEFGQLMNQSHISLRDDFSVTGRELDAIVEAAWEADGCIGARMTGAGFGGSAIALVKYEALDQFIIRVGKKYLQSTGLIPDFIIPNIDDGVREIVL